MTFPPHGHPTLQRCPECPAYLNHDGTGGLYCPAADTHRGSEESAPLPDGCYLRMEVYESGRIHVTAADALPVPDFAAMLHGIADAYETGQMEQVE